MELLSDIELYFTTSELIQSGGLTLAGEELHHAVNVMRHTIDDTLYVTNGEGTVFKSEITRITKSELTAKIIDRNQFNNPYKNIWFCIPLLKNPDRLKFAFEKCVELGITNFILFTSKHTISKKVNMEKFQKITLAAMKQSLRAFLPIIISATIDDIISTSGRKILFDQKSIKIFHGDTDVNETTYFLFWPEGGFDKLEIEKVNPVNHFSLSSNRLRSETAIIKCACLIKFT